jgi:hypothetical protein
MTITKSLLTAVSALTLATGAAFAGEDSDRSMALSSLETTDDAYFAQSELTLTDPMTLSSTGSTMEADQVYYIVPMEVVEVEEIWLIPSGDSEMPQG